MPLTHLLRSWLAGLARQKIQQTVVSAAEQHLHGSAGETASCDDVPLKPCDLGVVFALGIESGGLEDLLADVVAVEGHGFTAKRGTLEGHVVALAIAGTGREAAARATEAMITGHSPQWILSAGFAGGLQPELARNDMVMVDSVADTAGHQLALDLKIDRESLAKTPHVHLGRLLTVDQIVRLPEKKRELGRQYDALAVDMETFAVAEVCRRRQVPFLAVRVISDTVDEQLPADLEKLMQPKSPATQLGAALGTVWRRPSSVKDLYRLRENALLASDHLAKFLAAMVAQLPR